MTIPMDEEGRPLDWHRVSLTEEEADLLAMYADAGNVEAAEKVVEGAYARLYDS